MITIERKYHFYAAHRNELLQDKCRNLHGHTYYVTVRLRFDEPKANGVTMLFGDIDKVVEPLIKAFDHSLLLSKNDKLLPVLKEYMIKEREDLKIVVFPATTSVENLARIIYEQIRAEINRERDSGANDLKVSVQETTSAIVHYEPNKDSSAVENKD